MATHFSSALSFAFLASFGLAAAAQNTWYVDAFAPPPGLGTQAQPYASIQYALLQPTTVSGDVILVGPGTYAESVRFFGKAVQVRGSGVFGSIIDAAGLAQSTVQFVDGEQPGASLSGFLIVGGYPGDFSDGGGVLCAGSSGLIHDSLILNCGATTGVQFKGGGAAVVAGGELRLVRTTVDSCRSDSDGGAIYAENATLRLDQCTVRDSRTEYGRGGALAVIGGVLDVSNSTIQSNRAAEDDGGALFAQGASVRLVDTTVFDNYTENDHRGAGLALVGGTTVVERCRLQLNGSARGGAIHLDGGGTLTVERSHFADNYAQSIQAFDGSGGAIYCANGSSANVRASSFVNNRALSGPSGNAEGGALRGGSASYCTFVANQCDANFGVGAAAAGATLTGSIAWGNLPAARTLSNCSVTWSDIEGGAPGVGNIAVDPLVQYGLHLVPYLSAGSPCIDAGNPASSPDLDGTRADMGAQPFYGAPLGGPITYCQSSLTSAACSPYVTAGAAQPYLSSGLFELHAFNVPEGRNGHMFWGLQSTALPFQGGWLCVGSPQVRTPLQTSSTVGGLPGCAGSFVFRWTSAYTSALGVPPFMNVHAQFWFRDPGSASGTALSNAVRVIFFP